MAGYGSSPGDLDKLAGGHRPTFHAQRPGFRWTAPAQVRSSGRSVVSPYRSTAISPYYRQSGMSRWHLRPPDSLQSLLRHLGRMMAQIGLRIPHRVAANHGIQPFRADRVHLHSRFPIFDFPQMVFSVFLRCADRFREPIRPSGRCSRRGTGYEARYTSIGLHPTRFRKDQRVDLSGNSVRNTP